MSSAFGVHVSADTVQTGGENTRRARPRKDAPKGPRISTPPSPVESEDEKDPLLKAECQQKLANGNGRSNGLSSETNEEDHMTTAQNSDTLASNSADRQVSRSTNSPATSHNIPSITSVQVDQQGRIRRKLEEKGEEWTAYYAGQRKLKRDNFFLEWQGTRIPKNLMIRFYHQESSAIGRHKWEVEKKLKRLRAFLEEQNQSSDRAVASSQSTAGGLMSSSVTELHETVKALERRVQALEVENAVRAELLAHVDKESSPVSKLDTNPIVSKVLERAACHSCQSNILSLVGDETDGLVAGALENTNAELRLMITRLYKEVAALKNGREDDQSVEQKDFKIQSVKTQQDFDSQDSIHSFNIERIEKILGIDLTISGSKPTNILELLHQRLWHLEAHLPTGDASCKTNVNYVKLMDYQSPHFGHTVNSYGPVPWMTQTGHQQGQLSGVPLPNVSIGPQQLGYNQSPGTFHVGHPQRDNPEPSHGFTSQQVHDSTGNQTYYKMMQFPSATSQRKHYHGNAPPTHLDPRDPRDVRYYDLHSMKKTLAPPHAPHAPAAMAQRFPSQDSPQEPLTGMNRALGSLSSSQTVINTQQTAKTQHLATTGQQMQITHAQQPISYAINFPPLPPAQQPTRQHSPIKSVSPITTGPRATAKTFVPMATGLRVGQTSQATCETGKGLQTSFAPQPADPEFRNAESTFLPSKGNWNIPRSRLTKPKHERHSTAAQPYMQLPGSFNINSLPNSNGSCGDPECEYC
jgi:hypothetical protein